jgi:hypothetical protein
MKVRYKNMKQREFKTLMKCPVETIPYKMGERYMACILVDNGNKKLNIKTGSCEFFKTKEEMESFNEENDFSYESAVTVNVRRDFDKALENVLNGCELSNTLGYGFSKHDISNLAKLHKAGKHQEKIYQLLEDCNFHTANDDFCKGNYNKYIIED